jgi:uncharacterized protein YdcH (DUF465 family)
MTHTPHELSEEFPEHTDKIHELKVNNPHFARLAEEYHGLNREIHRIETRVEASSETREEELRKRRLHLKDEIAAILAKA